MAAGWSGQAVSILESLALVPLYLMYWSADRYGEWLALSALVAYLSTLDLGMNMAGANRMTQEYARGNLKGFLECQRAALLFYTAIALAGTLVVGVTVQAVDIHNRLGLRGTSRQDAAIVVFLMGAEVLWSMPAGLIFGTYRAMGNMSLSAWINNIQNISVLTLGAVCLVLHGGMIAIASVQLACLFATTTGVLLHLRWKHPEVMPALQIADLSPIRELVRPSASFGLLMLSEAIRLQAVILLISGRLGSAAVALFVSSRTMCNVMRQVTGVMRNALWPHVTAIEAQGRYNAVRVFHRFWVVVSTAMCLSIAATLWFEGADLMQVWTRGRLTADVILIRLLLTQLVLQAPWMASSLITVASSKHGRQAQAYFWSSVLGLAVAMALIGRLGLRAIPIASIAGEALLCYHFVTSDTCKSIGEPYLQFASRQWMFVITAAAIVSLIGWGAHAVATGPAVFRWAEVGIATSLAGAATAWTIGFRSEERASARALFHLVRT